MYLKKAYLLILPNNQLCLIPLGEVKHGSLDFENREKNCEIIKQNSKLHFWIYKANWGYNILGNKEHTAKPIEKEEIKKIISSNNGICYLEADNDNFIISPSNVVGERAIIIHIAVKEYVIATKDIDEGFVHTETNETCRFCEKNKIVSGIYLQFNKVGHPCCNTCYNKIGFNEWFSECLQMRRDIPKQLDWFVEMYYKLGLTPKEAINDMLSVV